jgi:tetratricopeptide (TPR) repeat protein
MFVPLLMFAHGEIERAQIWPQLDAVQESPAALFPASGEQPGPEDKAALSAHQAGREKSENRSAEPGKQQRITAEQLFQRAYLLIAEGQIENALAALDGIQAEDLEQKREVAYLHAWCSMLRDRWDEAAHYILPQEISGETIADVQELGRTERRRRPYYLLVLGDVAANLWRYEEAIGHYTRCLKFLDERRMNDTNRRVRALLGLGVAHMATGYLTNAIAYYEQALRLCNNDARQPQLPDLYYGLSDAYCRLGEFERALEYGNMALQLYSERGDKELLCRMRSLLGHIHCQKGDLLTANAYYTEALALAMSTESIGAIFTNFTALADLRLQEGKPEEAWRYCEMALDYSKKVPRPYFVGKMAMICGQVMEARAKAVSGARGQEYLERAVTYGRQAVAELQQTDARPDLAEAYGLLAHLLEESGRQDQALGIWKSAYAAQAGLADVPVM